MFFSLSHDCSLVLMIALFSPASFCVCLLYFVASFANVSAISFPSMFACALTFSILRLCRTCRCCSFVTVFVSCFEVLHLLKSLCIVGCEPSPNNLTMKQSHCWHLFGMKRDKVALLDSRFPVFGEIWVF